MTAITYLELAGSAIAIGWLAWRARINSAKLPADTVVMRPLRCLVVGILVVAAAGCGNTPSSPSAAQCMQAWNKGNSSTNGLVGRDVWAVGYSNTNGADEPSTVGCFMTFALGGGRYVMFEPDRDESYDEKSSAKQIAATGLDFQPDTTVSPVIVLTTAQLAAVNQGAAPIQPYPGGTPTGCQDDDGTVHPSGGCSPHDPSVTSDGIQTQIADTSRDTMIATIHWGPIWWLGPTLEGAPVVGGGGGKLVQGDNGRRVWYQVQSGGHSWQIGVITLDRAHPTIPKCPFWNPIYYAPICQGTTQLGQLITTANPAGRLIAVFATPANPDDSTRLPPTLVAQIRTSLTQATPTAVIDIGHAD